MQIQHRKYFSDITSVSDYYPFGSKMYGRRWEPVKPLYRFGFNTQEKVNEISPDHYTAKFWEYDARLGRRWNLDPKPDANWSMYSTFFDNPIKNVDWLGDKPLDDYKLDKKGNIQLIKKTNDKTDKLYNEDMTKSIELEKGILSNKKTYKIDKKDINFDVYEIKNENKAKDFFEFVAKNSDVEWSKIKMKSNINIITTSHKIDTEYGVIGVLNKNLIKPSSIIEHIHSHPRNTPLPSGIEGDKNTGDWGFSNWLQRKAGKDNIIQFKIYLPKYNQYISY